MRHGARVHHVGLNGSDAGLDAALPLRAAGPLRTGDEEIALLAGPNLYLSAGAGVALPPRPANLPGIAHLCLQAREADATRAALEGAAVTFLSSPVALGTGFRYAYAHDGAGRLLELETAPFLPAAPTAWFGHVAFVSENAQRLAGFYAALLDAELVPGGRFRDHPGIDRITGLDRADIEMIWVRADGFTLEFCQFHAPRAEPEGGDRWFTHLGLECADLDAAIARLAELGGAVEDRTSGADGRGAAARDPDGNRVYLFQLDEGARTSSVDALDHRDAIGRAAAAREAANAERRA